MTELNASKARKIFNHENIKREAVSINLCGGKDDEYLLAKGFLQAHALAERVLVGSIKALSVCGYSYVEAEAKAALSEWRKANGE